MNRLVSATAKSLGGNTDVLFYWPVSKWDEVALGGLAGVWKFARYQSSFVGIAMSFNSDSKALPSIGVDCLFANATTQAWVVVVGNSNTHGSFGAFIAAVSNAVFSNVQRLSGNIHSLESRVIVDGRDVSSTASY
jgi:hypothetical protein